VTTTATEEAVDARLLDILADPDIVEALGKALNAEREMQDAGAQLNGYGGQDHLRTRAHSAAIVRNEALERMNQLIRRQLSDIARTDRLA
jgi:hypothetical protein